MLMDCNYAITDTAKEDWIGGRMNAKKQNARRRAKDGQSQT